MIKRKKKINPVVLGKNCRLPTQLKGRKGEAMAVHKLSNLSQNSHSYKIQARGKVLALLVSSWWRGEEIVGEAKVEKQC